MSKKQEVQKLFSVEVFVFLQPFILSFPPSHPVLQSEDPFVVRLLFEPSGRPDSQQDYYLTAKENLCVVCGKVDSYIRCDFLIHLKFKGDDFFLSLII